MEITIPGRARKTKTYCPVHGHRLTDDDRALLANRLPAGGLPGRVRFLLDRGEWTVLSLASLVRVTPLTVRLLARGWRLPLGPGPRREVRRLIVGLVCPGCVTDRWREREEQEERDDRRARREALRVRHRAVKEARRRGDGGETDE
ncbi:hypothetical protein AB0G74_30030 [Streptomyces sp. NPDC020875]|uniref:hypothetical protein n=1 Tax=Streptomyces sp. NPDC020875 TaxID=3154898 RepID=UPI0033C2AE28